MTLQRIPSFGTLPPDFVAPTGSNPRFHFSSLGGVWTILLFFGSLGAPAAADAHRRILDARARFDDRDAYFFGVTIDPADVKVRGLKDKPPGIRYFRDFDVAVSRLYGVAGDGTYAPTGFLLDRQNRVVATAPASQVETLRERLTLELAQEAARTDEPHAPVLTLPRIFEPALCQALIAYFREAGGKESGFMRTIDGRTVGMRDSTVKRRRDAGIEDPELREATRLRIVERLTPAVERFYGWRATRIERYIVACYSAEDKGAFRPHRDNTTPGTAHRKFAVTINLNAEDYEGGELRFPEFSRRTYKPPTGGATVFGCSLLHEATPVTRGDRYAFLPFLYDEEGKRLREANLHTFAPSPEPVEDARAS